MNGVTKPLATSILQSLCFNGYITSGLFIYFVCMNILPVHMYVYHMFA